MPTPGIKGLRKIQLALETTSGTPAIATVLWRGQGVPEDRREVKFVNEDIGNLAGVDSSYIPKIEGGLNMEAVEATFEQLPYLLACGVENVVTGTADGAGSGKIYTYTGSTTSAKTIKSATIEGGDNQQMERMEYAFLRSFKLEGKPGEAVMMSAEWTGRQVKPNNLTASTISFTTSGGNKISDSAGGLGIFTTGCKVNVSGSTAGTNDGQFSVTAAATNSLTVTETVTSQAAGAAITVEQAFTALSAPSVDYVLFNTGKLYIDAVGGTIGTTLKSNTFLGMSLNHKTGFIPVYTADGQLYFSFNKLVKDEMEVVLDITFEHDGTATAEKAAWRSQLTRLVRLLFTGPTLTTAGTAYSAKTLRVDLAGRWEKFEKIGEQNGNDVISGTFRAKWNAAKSLFAQYVVVNEVASL